MRRTPPWLDAVGNLLVFVALLVGGLLWYRADRLAARSMARLQIQLDSLRGSSLSAELDIALYQALAAHSQIRPSTLLSGLTTDGSPLSVDLGNLNGLTILYSVDPDCVACTSNLPFLDDLDRLIAQKGGRGCTVDAVGVLVAAEREAVRLPELRGIRLLMGASGAAWDAVPFEQTPLLVLLRPPGAVMGRWRGILSVSDQEDVLARTLAACRDEQATASRSLPAT